MRLWSLHPKYLDTKGLLAVWREGLLAKHVLEGKTKGYKNHPQLERFKRQENPVEAIMQYLFESLAESERRGYHFDATKVVKPKQTIAISVTRGQIDYEKEHLLKKLDVRDSDTAERLRNTKRIMPHPMVAIVPDSVEDWEKR